MEEEKKPPRRISEMSELERQKLAINISENLNKLNPTDPAYISQLKVLNMLSKQKPKTIEFDFD